jgi:hypothetical protein
MATEKIKDLRSVKDLGIPTSQFIKAWNSLENEALVAYTRFLADERYDDAQSVAEHLRDVSTTLPKVGCHANPPLYYQRLALSAARLAGLAKQYGETAVESDDDKGQK